MLPKVEREFGKLDVLINNAGLATRSLRIHEMPLKDWNRVTGLTLQRAAEYGASGIRVNAIAPGWHLGTRFSEATGILWN